jgi:hypothetical protein
LELEPVHPQDLHFTLEVYEINFNAMIRRKKPPINSIIFIKLKLKNNYAKVGCKHKLKQDEFCK